jgi:hypothetical protein
MKRNLYTSSIMLISFLSFAMSIVGDAAIAQTSASSTFSVHSVKGRLTNPDGSAVANGSHTIVASIYLNGGATPIYTETDKVTTTGGVFDIMLGAGGSGSSKLNLSANGKYELGLSMDDRAQPRGRRVTFVTPEHSQRLSELRADRIKTRLVAQGLTADKIASICGSATSNLAVKE